jgi:hypothetical protein
VGSRPARRGLSAPCVSRPERALRRRPEPLGEGLDRRRASRTSSGRAKAPRWTHVWPAKRPPPTQPPRPCGGWVPDGRYTAIRDPGSAEPRGLGPWWAPGATAHAQRRCPVARARCTAVSTAAHAGRGSRGRKRHRRVQRRARHIADVFRHLTRVGLLAVDTGSSITAPQSQQQRAPRGVAPRRRGDRGPGASG